MPVGQKGATYDRKEGEIFKKSKGDVYHSTDQGVTPSRRVNTSCRSPKGGSPNLRGELCKEMSKAFSTGRTGRIDARHLKGPIE